jgi:hypothetical protein
VTELELRRVASEWEGDGLRPLRTREALAASGQRFRALVGLAAAAVVRIDLGGRWT